MRRVRTAALAPAGLVSSEVWFPRERGGTDPGCPTPEPGKRCGPPPGGWRRLWRSWRVFPRKRRSAGQRHSGLGGETSGEIAAAHEHADGEVEIHAVVAFLH